MGTFYLVRKKKKLKHCLQSLHFALTPVYVHKHMHTGFPGGTGGKEPACKCRRHRDMGSIPASGRSPGGGNGNTLQYSCLENPMDRGAWQATVHRVAKSQTRLKRLSMHMCTFIYIHIYIYISWRRKWQPTPVFLPGEFHGQRSLAGCSPWSHRESDMTKWLTQTHTRVYTYIHTTYIELLWLTSKYKFVFYVGTYRCVCIYM